MTSNELRSKFLEFFQERGHKVIPSASLVPENDPSVLFTTAGMHPLVPYLLGEKHPLGNKLCNVQKCLRTDDIDEVGDVQHLTFFEMLGYWSLGDYFKKESIHYTFDFYTQVLGFNKDDIFVTVFAGDDDAPFDQESFDTWKNEIGIPEDRIYKYGKKENWWGPVGATGPCGPDTEMFIDTGTPKCSDDCGPSCHCDKFVEIGNNVFMEYNKTADGKFEPLEQKNVDVGLGLERLAMFSQGKKDVFEIDTFEPVIKKIEDLSGKSYQGNEKAFRIIADHIRAAVFAIADGAFPSNKDRGYITRRLIRRAIIKGKQIGIEENFTAEIADTICHSEAMAEESQRSFAAAQDDIKNEIKKEIEKFDKTLALGLKIFEEKKNSIDGKAVFDLYQTYGFPLELSQEIARENKIIIDNTAIQQFNNLMQQHQELSRTASAGMFKGGLADNKVETTRLHTAAHLLLTALRQVLSKDVSQKGSNITEERLRFDFNWPEKLTPEQISEVENLVNEKIKENIPVTMEETTLEEALKNGATGSFGDRYGEVVKVYTISDFSKEICGGPHVKYTGELGIFRIKKEESSSAGVRRIKAILE
ncbi:MAG: alanine--tRNA ligase [Patescibacteria group bacterium]